MELAPACGQRQISNGKVELFQSNGDSSLVNDLSKGSFAFSAAPSSGFFGNLAAGSYFYRVTGDATGTVGGAYTLSSALSPTPEPGTFALLLAGLGVIGLLGRRRSPG